MKAYKCIGIYKNDTDKIFKLIDNDGNIVEINEENTINLMVYNRAKVINLTSHRYSISAGLDYLWSIESIENYKYLEGTELCNESEKVYHKATITNTNYDSKKNTSGTVVITDRTCEINESLYANTIIFVGNKKLINKSVESKSLKCEHAIIKNRCVMSNIVGVHSSNNIRLYAKHMYIQHNFIDINTVNEIFVIIMNRIENSFNIEVDRIYEVDFENVGIDNKDVLNRTMKLIKEYEHSETGALVCASLACSMYVSTKRIYNKLLATANGLINKYNYSDNKRAGALRVLLTKLNRQS